MGYLEVRRPPQPDVTKIPTPPLQAVNLFVNFFLPALALIAVVLRFYSRHIMRQIAIDIKLNYWGWHEVDVPPFDPSPGKWWFYLAQIFYNPVLALVKTSVLLFLLRLGGHKRNVRYFIYGLMTFNALQAIAVFLVAVFQCLPISANWDSEVAATAKCINPAFHITTSSITLVTDTLVLVIPFWIFLGLKLPLAARIAIIGAFLTGLAVTIIGAVRLYNVYKLFFAPPGPHYDPYYDFGISLNALEVNLAIVSAAVPALRPLFRKWFPSLFGGSTNKYSNDAYKYKTNEYGRPTGIRSGVRNGTESGLAHGHGGIALKSLGRNDRSQHTEIRSVSPTGSEEEIMTPNGIMRTTDVHINYTTESILNHSGSRASSDFKTSEAIAPRGL
ncbi:hypothetical protein CHU98_g1446 [Xylaria longipes]|nr:hypothetical protein CHU98_g1446 [Xylaria longipes]